MTKSLSAFNRDDNSINNFFRPFVNFPYFPEFQLPSLDYEMFEEGDKLKVQIKTPGYTKENLVINVENGVLNVSGEMSDDKEEKKGRTYYKEHSSSSFSQSISLPIRVDESKVEAKLNDGILHIVFAKVESDKVKKIKIN